VSLDRAAMKALRFLVIPAWLGSIACSSEKPAAESPEPGAPPEPAPAAETAEAPPEAATEPKPAPPPAELSGDALLASILDGKPAYCASADRIIYLEVTTKPSGDTHTVELVKSNGKRETTLPACTADKSGSCTATDAAKKTILTKLGADPCRVIGELGKPMDADVAFPDGKRRLAWKTDAVWIEGAEPAKKLQTVPVQKGYKASPSAWWALPDASFVLVRIVQESEGKPIIGKTHVIALAPSGKP